METTINKMKVNIKVHLVLLLNEFFPKGEPQEIKLKQLQKYYNKAMITSSTYLLNKYSRLDTAGIFIDYPEFVLRRP